MTDRHGPHESVDDAFDDVVFDAEPDGMDATDPHGDDTGAYDDAFDGTDTADAGETDEPFDGGGTGGGGGGGGGGIGRAVTEARETISPAGFAAAAAVFETERRGAEHEERDTPSLQLATELVLAEIALATIEDEHTRLLDGDDLLAYDELDPDDIAAELIDRREQQDQDFARAEMNRLAWYVRGWQMLLDHDFDFAVSGQPLPDRSLALRGAISAAIARVGGLPSRRVGGYVAALRKSRTTAAEPYVTKWLRNGAVPDELRQVLPEPVDTPAWRRAAEAALVLEATGELTGRRAPSQLVLAVSHSLADLNDARRAMGLGVIRLSAIDRNAQRLVDRANDRQFEIERGMSPGSYPGGA